MTARLEKAAFLCMLGTAPLLGFVAVLLCLWAGPIIIASAIGLTGLVPMWILGVAGPFGYFTLRDSFSDALDVELAAIEEHGAGAALWVKVEHGGGYVNGTFVRPIFSEIIWHGHDSSYAAGKVVADLLGLPEQMDNVGPPVLSYAGSWLWSNLVWTARDLRDSRLVRWAPFGLHLALIWKLRRRLLSMSVKLFDLWLLAFCIAFFAPSGHFAGVFSRLLRSMVFLRGLFMDELRREYVRWRFTQLFAELLVVLLVVNSEIKSQYSESLSNDRRAAVGMFRRQIMSGVKMVSDIGLPSYVRRRFNWTYSRKELEAGRSILSTIGWPVNVELTDPSHVQGAEDQYPEWLVAGSDFRTGIKKSQMAVDQALAHLVSHSNLWERTENYQSVANELESTARYFRVRDVEVPSVDLDDAWHVIGVIFRRSKLTPFNTIIGLWEKKYALGFFMRDPLANRKYKRRDFIASLGYKNFKALWARTFYWASMVLPVAHVSVKGEALPASKWMANKVRTVIGSPISQYILSTIFSHGPNHRFAWDVTPIKIGMPLNGFWMASLFNKHSKYQVHVEGDFSAFDSSLYGELINIIKEIRKRGYEFHKDHAAICDLIDVNYDLTTGQMLGMTSTGNIYKKGTGLTTGHSSTSMDNSIVCVVLYLTAWKKLTGLSAREFLHYNELSVYGDDHLWSFSATRPRAWSPRNVAKVMATWGVVNNVESKSLSACAFLHKHARKVNNADIKLFRDNNLAVPNWIVWHSKERLIGKLTAPIKNTNPTYRLRRMMSYLELCAHHPDVYDAIVEAINKSSTMKHHLKANNIVIPSYSTILRRWYSKSPATDLSGLDEDEVVADGRLLQYGSLNLVDVALGALSILPDLLNPQIFNLGFVRSLQMQLAPMMSWCVELFLIQNDVVTASHAQSLMRKTAYKFVDPGIFAQASVGTNISSLLVRHWLFMAYVNMAFVIKPLLTFDFVVKKVASIQFLLNGIVQSELPTADFSLDRILVVCILSLVSIPSWIDFIGLIKLPDAGVFIDLGFNKILSTLWMNVPSTYRELEPLLKNGGEVLVTAPTGTGKSTNMIAFLREVSKSQFTHVVVIEPRVMLAVGLATYVENAYGMRCTSMTSMSTFDDTARVWYCTAGSLLAHIQRLNANQLLVVDEAHVSSVELQVVLAYARKIGMTVWHTTATPTQQLVESATAEISLPVASIWKSTLVRKSLPPLDFVNAYFSQALAFVSTLSKRDKVAVILDTPEQAENFSYACGRVCQVLSSRHDPVVQNVPVYACTNVIDVGVTIPDLSFILTPNWDYAGQGTRYELSSSQLSQRRGRVGRTRNGTCIFYETEMGFPVRPNEVAISAIDMRGLLLSGVSPVVLQSMNASVFDETVSAYLGADAPLNSTQIKQLSLFLDNFRPVLAAAAIKRHDSEKPDAMMHVQPMGMMKTLTKLLGSDLTTGVVNVTSIFVKEVCGQALTSNEADLKDRLSSVVGTKKDLHDVWNKLLNNVYEGFSANYRSRFHQELSDYGELQAIAVLLKDIMSEE